MIDELTILITTRNRPDFLTVALESVRQAFGEKMKVTIGDNGDPETTQELLRARDYFGLDVTHVANPPGSTYTDNLQTVVDACQTPWFSLLHDDDFFVGVVGGQILPLLGQADVDFVFSDHWVAHNDGRLDEALTVQNSAHYGRNRLTSGPVSDLGLLFMQQSICLDGFFCRTAFAQKHRLDRSLPVFAQNKWMPEILHGRKGGYLSDRLFAYRQSSISLTAQGMDRFEILTALLGIRLPPGGAYEALKAKIRLARWSALKNSLKTGKIFTPRVLAIMMKSGGCRRG